MSQSYQVIGQHNIIKNQDTKIKELKEQLRIASIRDQTRYLQITQNNKIILEEKDKTISYLKDELERSLTNRLVFMDEYNKKLQQSKNKWEQEIIIQKDNYMDLEQKFYRVEKESQIQIECLQKQNSILQKQNKIILEQNNIMKQQIEKLKQINYNNQIQIEKLTNFCKTFIKNNDNQKNLLQVNKFINQLENYKKKQKITLDNLTNFVKNQTNIIKQNLKQIIREISINQNNLLSDKKQCDKGVNAITLTLKEDCEGILQQNQKFWNKLIKMEKQTDQKNEIKNMKNQIQNCNERYSKQIEQYKNLIKVYQDEKKQLTLGFQQLRSINEGRQTIYQDEIKQLKKNIEELIETGSQRDQQFDKKIKIMSTQIQNITQRYYTNIEIPVLKIKQKLCEQFDQIKSQLRKINSTPSLKTSMDSLQRIMSIYIEKNTKQKHSQDLSKNIYQLTKVVKLILSCTNEQNKITGILQHKQNNYDEKSNKKYYYEEEKQKTSNFKQKLNNNHFQLILAKKHFNKLKQHCEELEKNNGNKSFKQSDKDNQVRKIMELQAQNQALKENVIFIKQQYQEEIQNIKLFKENHNPFGYVDKIRELSVKIQNNLREQSQHYTEMKYNLKIIKNGLLKPMQQFEKLIKQISQINLKQIISSIPLNKIQNNINNFTINNLFQNQINIYKNFIIKKNNNYYHFKKLLDNLIKLLNQSKIKQYKQKLIHIKKQQKFNYYQNKQQSSNQKQQIIQKKIKQIQYQRIKQKQQIITKISKIQSNLNKIIQKIQQNTQLKNHLQKLQINIQSKMNQIINKIQTKDDNKQLLPLKENILADLKIKLEDVNNQNLILRNQMSLIYSQTKI